MITFEHIVNAASKLKIGKHDGHYGLSSDHVINACDELYIHIAMLLSALVVHGYITEDLSWNGSYSHDIKILYGVRQGAVLAIR